MESASDGNDMVIVVYSETDADLIERKLGDSEYSYHFVLKAFYPILERLGRVFTVTDPNREVDVLYRRAIQSGEDCIFLSFSPPHRTPLDLACPTIPVFAWEYDTIPSETWGGERQQDWRFALNKFGRGITHSISSVGAVRSAMGPDFPIASIPAPVFDRFETLREKSDARANGRRPLVSLPGRVVDSRALDLGVNAPDRPGVGEMLATDPGRRPSEPVLLEFEGVVYTAILNPYDNRKNHFDLISGFCWAFREIEDANLLIKLAYHDVEPFLRSITEQLRSLSPFKCRVVLTGSYLAEEDYGNLLLAATYAVNTSQGEGQCLPLMESMALGKPAVAPRHTGMMDYLSPANAFLVASTIQPAAWPQDPRRAYRAFSYRIDFESLVSAFRDSYRVAKEHPKQYQAMADQAQIAAEQHNSDAVVLERLASFLTMAPCHRAVHSYGNVISSLNIYSPGSLLDFANDLDARRYLGSGWGDTEIGFGVWSDSALAELSFRLKRRPTKPLRLRINLTAFVVREHPELTVHVIANDLAIARWEFSLTTPEVIHGAWHEAVIPLESAWDRQFSIKLKIEFPASPRELGLSSDIRLLGILLHRLSLSPSP